MWSEFRRVKIWAAVLLSVALLFNLPAAKAENPWHATSLRDHALAGKIYDVAGAKLISREELFARIDTVRHVLLGETHDNAEHHLNQGVIIQALVEASRRPVVVLEMLTDKNADLVQRLNTTADTDAPDHALLAELETAWKKAGWPDILSYSPVFGSVQSGKLLLSVGEPSPPDDERVSQLLTTAPLTDPHTASLNKDLEVSHCGVLPESVIPRIAVAQRKRDIKLALALQAAHGKGGDGTVLIAGSGHARKDRGVPHYLRHLGEMSVTINFREVVQDKTDVADLIEPGEADYIWFTPRHEREDPCIALRKRFGKKKK